MPQAADLWTRRFRAHDAPPRCPRAASSVPWISAAGTGTSPILPGGRGDPAHGPASMAGNLVAKVTTVCHAELNYLICMPLRA